MDSWIWNTAPQRFHLALFGKILWIDRSKIKFANGFLLIHFIITKTGNKVFASKNNSFTMHNGLNWIKFLDKGAFYLHLHCICTANHWKTQMHQNIIRIWKEWRHFIVPSTDMGFTSFSSGELTIASILNAVDKKLANPISVHYGESNTVK